MAEDRSDRTAPHRAPPSAALAGTTLGPYRIIGFLGAGGMSEVYRAVDTRLGRQVAIKVLRPSMDLEEEADDLLLQEAQAMAKLSHPHVVAVYEVDLEGRQPYVVMELVEGENAREWLRKGRTWREIVALYADAGRGLHAAHQAGLVHRDFKPDNVLVGTDGRVRVSDFGLAGLVPASPSEDERASLGVEATVRYSRTARGTPAYMAPEQHLAEAVDARTDQFAFGIALHEALAGARPFPGKDIAAVRAGVLAGKPASIPRERKVPAWIRAVLTRTLARRPEDRYPTMAAVVAALGNDPARRRWQLGIAAGLAGLAVLAAVGFLHHPTPPVVCDGNRDRIALVWNDGRRAAMTSAFAATRRPYAAEENARVARALDGYAGALSAMHRETCEATAIRHTQSPALLDRRMECLDRRLLSLGALVGQLVTADGIVVDRAVRAAAQLEPLDRCADATALTAILAPPGDPAVRARVDALRARLGEAQAESRAGRWKLARAGLDPLIADVRAANWPPLTTDAMYFAANLFRQVGDNRAAEAALNEAMPAGAEARDDEAVARAAVLLLWVVGVDEARAADASALVPAARAAVARTGGKPVLAMRLVENEGAILIRRGQFAEAIPLIESAVRIAQQPNIVSAVDSAIVMNELAVALRRAGRTAEAEAWMTKVYDVFVLELGTDHPDVAGILINLGSVHIDRGDYLRAAAELQRAAAIWTDVLGPEDANVARALTNLGNAYAALGRFADALTCDEQSLVIKEKRLGPEHIDLSTSLLNAAGMLIELGRTDAAQADAERSRTLREKAFGAESQAVAEALGQIALARAAKGEVADGLETVDRAVAMDEKKLGPEHGDVATLLDVRAHIELDAGQKPAALADARRALAIREKKLAPGHPELGGSLAFLGTALLANGKPAEAVDPLVRALPLVARGAPGRLGRAHFDLARAYGKSDARSKALAQAAHGELAAAEGVRAKADLAAVDAWLGKR